jgi:serine protease Do
MRKLAFIACVAMATAVPVQGQERPRAAQPGVVGYTITTNAQNRAVLGITTQSGGAADTLGVRVTSVTTGGPADRAGITEGARIVGITIGGATPSVVNLRLGRDDATAGDLGNVLSRRLQRAMADVQPGDEVTLRLAANGGTREVRVRTVAASELPRESIVRSLTATMADPQRPMLGISVTGTGTARDTLGLFVASVVRDGPAERAGIIEGYRVAEINGVSVRVPRDDAGDRAMSTAMSARFTRELRKAEPGQTVRLRVWADGRYRDVNVTAVAASELRGATGFPGGIELFPGAAERIEIIRGVEGPLRQLEQELREMGERTRQREVQLLAPGRVI